MRQNLGMYIGNNGPDGMHHLLTEIISNAMDEAAAGYGNLIEIIIDKEINRVTVRDRGRGIPFHKNSEGRYAIVEMCTSLHSGGKFEGQTNYKSSLGLHGIGATVTAALSTNFEIKVWKSRNKEDGNWKDGEHCHFIIDNGNYDDPVIEKYSGKEQGSQVSFIPDPLIFGKEKWDIDKIKASVQLHALLNNGIRFKIIVRENGLPKDTTEFYYTNGIQDMLKLKTEGLQTISDPVYCKTVTEDEGETCEVEFAFTYCLDKGYETIYSFVNGGYTPNNGTHVTGWKSAYTSYINKLAKEEGFLKDGDSNLSGDLIRKGIVLVLSIKMSARPMFAEQTKQTLNSPAARKLVSRAVPSLELNKKQTKQILDKIILEKKAEEAAQRKREAQDKNCSWRQRYEHFKRFAC